MVGIFRPFYGLLLILGLISVGIWGFHHYLYAEPSLDPFRQTVVEMAANQIAEKLPSPPIPGLLCFTELSGDEKGIVTKYLIGAIDDTGKYKCTGLEDVYLSLKEMGIERVLNYETAQKVGKKLNADLVSLGKVVIFSRDEKGSLLSINLTILTVRDKTPLFQDITFSGKLEPGFSLAYYRAWISSCSFWSKFLVWFLITIISPFIFIRPITFALESESNMVNLGLLICLTTLTFITTIGLLGFSLSGVGRGISAILGILFGGMYNYTILTWIDKNR